MKTLNLAGRQISRLRYEREWTPEDLGRPDVSRWLAQLLAGLKS